MTNGLDERSGSETRKDGERAGRVDLARLLAAMPPAAVEAEMSLLGAILIEPRVVSDVITIVRNGEDFFRPVHGVLYESMVQLYDKNGSVDTVQLRQHLEDRGVLDDIGGIDYLVRLAESVPSAANAAYYARLVREKATVRELIHAAGEILEDAYGAADESQKILEAAEQRIFHIAQKRESAAASSLRDLLEETMRILDRSEGSGLTGVPTGYADLDEITNGLQPGEMIILAARPSMGKTAFALNAVENMALAGHAVAFFSLEMGRQQLVQRLLCSRGQIDSQRMRRNMLGKDDYRRLMAAASELQEAPIFIDDTPGLTLLQMRSKARRLHERHGIKAVVIDYLQLMSSGARVESRQLEVSEISRGIKAMARELDVPVMCLSQLNRAAEQREGHRPRMSDLRESGSIEQDADVVSMLHREEYYHRHDPSWSEANPDKVGTGELIIAKQRNGPTGVIDLVWDGSTTRFKDRVWTREGGAGGAGGYGGERFNAGSAAPPPSSTDLPA